MLLICRWIKADADRQGSRSLGDIYKAGQNARESTQAQRVPTYLGNGNQHGVIRFERVMLGQESENVGTDGKLQLPTEIWSTV